MVKINCIITDDEPIAQDIIEDYIKMIPELNLCAKCYDAVATLSELNNQTIDLLFLDIKMPGISGINFLKSIKNPPLVIFTTAYPEFAVDGFDLDVVDYLLKPISFERFFKSVSKVFDKIDQPKPVNNSSISTEKNYLFVKTNKKYVRIPFAEIMFIESAKDYVKIFTNQQSILTLSTMKEMEASLPSQQFFRTHHSYIVQEDKIDFLEGNTIIINDHRIPISKKYKPTVLKRLI